MARGWAYPLGRQSWPQVVVPEMGERVERAEVGRHLRWGWAQQGLPWLRAGEEARLPHGLTECAVLRTTEEGTGKP